MDLKDTREVINEIDAKMAELFEERMKAVKVIAEYKSERGLPVEDKEREKALLDSMAPLIKDEEIRPFYVNFLQSTIDVSKKMQRRLMNGLKVACTSNKFTDADAAKRVFPEAELTICESIEEAYRAAEDGTCDVAFIPLENSDRGDVGKAYDLIFSGNLFVNSISAIERDGSTTRYAVLSRARNDEKFESDRETFLIMFTVKDEVGGLAKAINIISAYGYNMKVLRSRPMKDLAWHYYFYAELSGPTRPDGEERIMRGLQAACPTIKVAGHFEEESEIHAGDA